MPAGRARLAFTDLADQPLILFDEGASIRHMLNLFRAKGLRPRITHRAASLEVMRSLAAHGEGVGISYTVPPSGQSYDGKAIAAIPIDEADALEEIVLVHSRLAPPHEEMARIIEMLRALPAPKGQPVASTSPRSMVSVTSATASSR